MFINVVKQQPSAQIYIVESIISIIIYLGERQFGTQTYLVLFMIPMYVWAFSKNKDHVTSLVLLSSNMIYLGVFHDINKEDQRIDRLPIVFLFLFGRSFANSKLITNFIFKSVYFVFVFTLNIVYQGQWQQLYQYLVFIYMVILIQQDWRYQEKLKQSQDERIDLQQEQLQLQELLSMIIPASICAFTQNEVLFQTKEMATSFILIDDFIESVIKLDQVVEFLNETIPDKHLQQGQYKLLKTVSIQVYQEHNQFLQPQFDSNLNQIALLDFVVAHCVWKGQSAVLIIVDDYTKLKAENQMLRNKGICDCKDKIILDDSTGQRSQTQNSKSNDKNVPTLDDLASLKAQIEQLKRQETCKDNILASVSHDFKTPINGVVQIIEHLEKLFIIYYKSQLVQDEKVLYQLKIIKQSNYFLLFMIYDILDFAMIQQNQLRLCHSRFDLQETIQEMIELLKMQAQEKHVRLCLNSSIKKFPMYSDPNRLKQIILNLLSNALKYTESGLIEVIIESSLRPNQSSGAYNTIDNLIQITVKDTGVGIPDSIKSKLFDMYATFDHQKGSNRNGIGLGLSICKNLVGLLGPTDEIKLVTEVGQGSSFSFNLFQSMAEQNPRSIDASGFMHVIEQTNQMTMSYNRKQSQVTYSSSQLLIFQRQQVPQINTIQEFAAFEQNSLKQYNKINEQDMESNEQFLQELYKKNQTDNLNFIANSSIKTTNSILRDKRILIVDDEPFNVMAFKTLFSPYAEIDEAFNGQQALKKVQIASIKTINMKDQQRPERPPYDYIFMDLTMPIMNGYDAAKELKSLIRKQVIPYIPLIALTGFDDLQEKEKCYAVGFDAFMSKPVKFQALLTILRELECQIELFENLP